MVFRHSEDNYVFNLFMKIKRRNFKKTFIKSTHHVNVCMPIVNILDGYSLNEVSERFYSSVFYKGRIVNETIFFYFFNSDKFSTNYKGGFKKSIYTKMEYILTNKRHLTYTYTGDKKKTTFSKYTMHAWDQGTKCQHAENLLKVRERNKNSKRIEIELSFLYLELNGLTTFVSMKKHSMAKQNRPLVSYMYWKNTHKNLRWQCFDCRQTLLERDSRWQE